MTNMRVNMKQQSTFAFEELISMSFNAVYPRLYFWLGSALVALMDAPPLKEMRNLPSGVGYTLFTYAPETMQFHKGPGSVVYVDVNEGHCVNNQGHYKNHLF